MKSFSGICRLLLILFLTSFLAACGASKSSNSDGGSADLSSRGNVDTGSGGSLEGNNGNTPISSGILTECNDISREGLDARLTTYYDSLTGRWLESYIRFDIKTALPAMISQPGKYIQIFKWFAKSDGTPSIAETPVPIYLVHRQTGTVLNYESPDNYLSGALIGNYIESKKLNISIGSFFDHYLVVLGSLSLDYDAIRIATYDDGDSKAIDNFDALLPAFAADPNEYYTSHPSLSLAQLHPNWDQRAGEFSAAQYKEMAEDSCRY